MQILLILKLQEGARLNVNPLLVVFCVTIGGSYGGLVGMFIAVPIGVLIKLMIDDFVDHKLEKKEKGTIKF